MSCWPPTRPDPLRQAPPQVDGAPTTRALDSNPCSKLRKVCVRDSCESQPRTPGCPAAVKSSTQEPIVKASVTIAAVAALSEIEAAKSAIEPISIPYNRCPKNRLRVSG